jgi:hypothetical protein
MTGEALPPDNQKPKIHLYSNFNLSTRLVLGKNLFTKKLELNNSFITSIIINNYYNAYLTRVKSEANPKT